jgi:hypothetical protein
MKKMKSSSTHRLGASIALATGLLCAPVSAVTFSNLLFSDNFFTGLSDGTHTPDLNTNIGPGSRQGGHVVTNVNPAAGAYDVYGKVEFTTNNGWDLRSQTGWPTTGAVDQYTLRYRDNATAFSAVSPQIGFNSFIVDDSYRIQVQVVHANPGVSDRWAGITFGANNDRFPLAPFNGGVIITSGGGVQVFANGNVIHSGAVAPEDLPANGAFLLDLQVHNNWGALYVNNALIAPTLNLTMIDPAVISLSAFLGADPAPATIQIRFDDFAVSTIPEPSTYAMIFGALVLGAALLRRRFRKA